MGGFGGAGIVPVRLFLYVYFYLIKVSCYLSLTLVPNDPAPEGFTGGFLPPTPPEGDGLSYWVELDLAAAAAGPLFAEPGFGRVLLGPLELEARAGLRFGVELPPAAARAYATLWVRTCFGLGWAPALENVPV